MTDSADMVRGSGCYAHDLSFIACRMRLEQRRPKDHGYRMLSDQSFVKGVGLFELKT